MNMAEFIFISQRLIHSVKSYYKNFYIHTYKYYKTWRGFCEVKISRGHNRHYEFNTRMHRYQ